MSVVVILSVVKFSRFLFKDKSENTFIKYVVPRAQVPRHYKIRQIFATNNTLAGSCAE